MNNIVIQPQKGPQTAFLECQADIALFGGAAGGGKTHALLMQPLVCVQQAPGINCATFRRFNRDLTNVGGLWPESYKMYPMFDAQPNKIKTTWEFKNKSYIQFAGLQYEDDKDRWKGSQIDVLQFDELTEFTESQFWFMVGRTRSVSGNVKPFIRAATNPEPNWVCDMVRWWLTSDGYADPDKSGKIRWFYRYDGQFFWHENREDACADIRERGLPKYMQPLSFTFIPSKLDDNQILLQNDPLYYAKLASLDTLDRKRLLEGNWFVKPTGKVFKSHDFKIFAIAPKFEVKIITIDTAQQTKTANDYTVAQVWGRADGKAYLVEQIRGKFDFLQQVQVIKNLAIQHKPNWVIIEQAANGLPLLQTLRKEAHLPLFTITRNKDKYQRAMEIQGYIQSGYVYLDPAAAYYPELMAELTTFSENAKERAKLGAHDDQVDALVDAVYYLLYNKIGKITEKKTDDKRPLTHGLAPYGTERPLQRPQFDSISSR